MTTTRPRFSLGRVATPARQRAQSAEPPRKIPKAAELAVAVGPKPPPRRPASKTSDIVLCIYKYSDDAQRRGEIVVTHHPPLPRTSKNRYTGKGAV